MPKIPLGKKDSDEDGFLKPQFIIEKERGNEAEWSNDYYGRE